MRFSTWHLKLSQFLLDSLSNSATVYYTSHLKHTHECKISFFPFRFNFFFSAEKRKCQTTVLSCLQWLQQWFCHRAMRDQFDRWHRWWQPDRPNRKYLARFGHHSETPKWWQPVGLANGASLKTVSFQMGRSTCIAHVNEAFLFFFFYSKTDLEKPWNFHKHETTFADDSLLNDAIDASGQSSDR